MRRPARNRRGPLRGPLRSPLLLAALLLNDGQGLFRAALAGPVTRDGKDTRALLFCDVDLDGRLDLLAANFGECNNLYLNRGGDRWQVVDSDPLVADAGRTTGAAFGDVDGDGLPELAIASGLGGDDILLVNRGSFRRDPRAAFAGAPQPVQGQASPRGPR